MKDTVKKYLEKKSLFKNKTFDCEQIAICIPVCNEYPNFINVLKSLAISCSFANVKVQVVCCVNNKKNSNNEILENNYRMVNELTRISKFENLSFQDETLLKISVLDYTREKAFDENQGVGWARKIAMDYALVNGAKVLACLDADTLVKENYCYELKKFLENKMQCATMNFFHPLLEDENRNEKTLQINLAISEYENYIKTHSIKLKECGTPFYYSALGCILVCSDVLYAECGGMKNKLAGEDFYFLQEMIKNRISKNPKDLKNPIDFLETEVMPATRFSDRVLFGTGKTLQNIVNDKIETPKIFKDKEYNQIKEFIFLFNELNKKNFPLELQREAEQKCRGLYEFLLEDGFFSDWESIVNNNKKSSIKLAVAFHCKFDGLKIIRSLHYLQKIKQ